jgi:CHASE2 domain-containing sensor protein/signal transduction histidine kinase
VDGTSHDTDLQRVIGHRARNRLAIEWWSIGLLVTIFAVLFVAYKIPHRLDNLFYDEYLYYGQHEPDPQIAIVAIDNRSLKEVGAWPWPRDVHAGVVNSLHNSGARIIGYDVLFAEPTTAAADKALGDAIAKAGSVVVPLMLEIPGPNGLPFRAVEPVEPVRSSVAAVGHANLTFDPDGLVRRVYLDLGTGHQKWHHVSEIIAAIASGQKLQVGTSPPRKNDPSPVVAGRPIMLDYIGAPGSFPTISAADVLRGEVPAEFFHGKIVLVGATANGMGDSYPTPLAGSQGIRPGVDIMANLLTTLLRGNPARPLGLGWNLAFSLLPLWALLILLRRAAPRHAMLFTFGLIASALIGSALLLLVFRLWAPPATLILGAALVYPIWSWRRLSAINQYMVAELSQFRSEPDFALAGDAPPKKGSDAVGHQIALLNHAISRARDLRLFAFDRLNQLPDPTWVTDLDGTILLSNHATGPFQQTIAPDIALNGHISQILSRLRVVENDLETPACPTLPDPTEESPIQIEAATDDGRSLGLRIALQKSHDGKPLGWIVRIVDVTEARLAQRHREAMLQLLTHDMRTPQAAIIALIDNPTSQNIGMELLARIRYYARRTLDLADSFVQLARAESLSFAHQDVNLTDILLDAVDDAWPISASRNISVHTEGTHAEYWVSGDRLLLTRAIINLLTNALKYSADGTRVICKLELAIEAGQSMVACSIIDQGCGIPKERTATIFQRFGRVPMGGFGHVEGVGLGLSLVQAVAIRHGGTVGYTSTEGVGSTFTIKIPLSL